MNYRLSNRKTFDFMFWVSAVDALCCTFQNTFFLAVKFLFSFSSDHGFVLTFQVSPYSGRLQLVDMTGSIDVIVPDLSLNWSANSIYEVIINDSSTSHSPSFCCELRLVSGIEGATHLFPTYYLSLKSL